MSQDKKWVKALGGVIFHPTQLNRFYVVPFLPPPNVTHLGNHVHHGQSTQGLRASCSSLAGFMRLLRGFHMTSVKNSWSAAAIHSLLR